LGKISRKSARGRRSKPSGPALATERTKGPIAKPSDQSTADGSGKKRAAYLPPNFETFSAAEAEDALRSRLLFRDLMPASGGSARRLFCRVDALNLACDLLSASEGAAPESLASSVHMRTVRASMLSSLSAALGPYANKELRTATIINTKWRFSPLRLLNTSAMQLKRQQITHLRRAGVLALDGFTIGFLHGEFEPTSNKFQLHFHLVTTANRERAIKSMAGRWGYTTTATGAAPIVCQRLGNRNRQLSYLIKSYWPERPVVMMDGKPTRVRTPRRIKGLPHSVALMWLHRQPISRLTIVSNATVRRNKIKLKK